RAPRLPRRPHQARPLPLAGRPPCCPSVTMFVLDTNVISEPTAKRPDARAVAWLAAQDGESLFLTALTLGELRCGILLLDVGRKKRGLLNWLETEIKPAFAGRILPADAAVMEKWADLAAAATRAG